MMSLQKQKSEHGEGAISELDIEDASDKTQGGTVRKFSIANLKSLMRYLYDSFENPSLESIYKGYFANRRKFSLLFLLLSVTTFNVIMVALAGAEYHKTS